MRRHNRGALARGSERDYSEILLMPVGEAGVSAPDHSSASVPATPAVKHAPIVTKVSANLQRRKEIGQERRERTRAKLLAAAAQVLADGAGVNSWFLGRNIPGKLQAPLFFFGGANNYFIELEKESGGGFKGMQFRRPMIDAAAA